MNNLNVIITEFLNGPFEIVVTNPESPNDKAFPIVISPDGVYQTSEQAVQYVEKHFANRKTPYLDLQFYVVSKFNEREFIEFCSWEE